MLFSFGEGNGTPLQYSCLENPMDGGAWWAAVHGAAKSWTRLSDFTFTFHFHALEKEMATRSSVLAWRVPGTGEPGGLPSMGSHRVGHDWSDLAAARFCLRHSGFAQISAQCPVLLPKIHSCENVCMFLQIHVKCNSLTLVEAGLSLPYLCPGSSPSTHRQGQFRSRGRHSGEPWLSDLQCILVTSKKKKKKTWLCPVN